MGFGGLGTASVYVAFVGEWGGGGVGIGAYSSRTK